jgi:hypothetical protein
MRSQLSFIAPFLFEVGLIQGGLPTMLEAVGRGVNETRLVLQQPGKCNGQYGIHSLGGNGTEWIVGRCNLVGSNMAHAGSIASVR